MMSMRNERVIDRELAQAKMKAKKEEKEKALEQARLDKEEARAEREREKEEARREKETERAKPRPTKTQFSTPTPDQLISATGIQTRLPYPYSAQHSSSCAESDPKYRSAPNSTTGITKV